MQTVSSLADLSVARLSLHGVAGLIPTMGYLHQGHVSLAHRARAECDSVIASIFVNPAQFGPDEDLSKYPRNLERDLQLLKAAGVDVVWTPTPEVIYPSGFSAWVEVEGLTAPLEGAARPGHFRGVTTVVAKLFNVIQPQRAYFGQKDAQQAAVIRKMTRDLNFPVEIVVCPTVREADGLAMSSRNSYLSPEQRQAATVLFRSLNAAQDAYERGERDAEALRGVMAKIIASESLAKMQYVSVADYDTLEERQVVSGKTLFSMAVFIGKTRLIDNFVIG